MSIPIPRILVVGGGGHARSVMDAISASGVYEIAGIVDPDSSASYLGHTVLGSDDDLFDLHESGFEVAAIGVGYLGGGDGSRARVYKRLLEVGFELPNIVDPTAAVAADVVLGEAAFVGKLAVINTAAVVGDGAIINSGAVVEHDCAIGQLAHVSVNATLCGGVTVGEGAMIGAGATVIQGVRIGKNAIVGAGSVVLRDVPEATTVVGVFHG